MPSAFSGPLTTIVSSQVRWIGRHVTRGFNIAKFHLGRNLETLGGDPLCAISIASRLRLCVWNPRGASLVGRRRWRSRQENRRMVCCGNVDPEKNSRQIAAKPRPFLKICAIVEIYNITREQWPWDPEGYHIVDDRNMMHGVWRVRALKISHKQWSKKFDALNNGGE